MKKYRFDEQTIQKLLERQWWNESAEELKKVGEMEFRVGEYVGKDEKREMRNRKREAKRNLNSKISNRLA